MCGRFTLKDSPRYTADYLGAHLADGVEESWLASYNTAPTCQVLAVTADARSGDRVLDQYRWGLIPSWIKDLSNFRATTFNARSEDLASKPMFRNAFRTRRALIPANSFFEWRKSGDKQPYLFRRVDGDIMAFAGLWEVWKHPEGKWLRSCTIITTKANTDMGGVHDRMPVVLEPGAWERWLDPSLTDGDELDALLHAGFEQRLEHYPVDKRVGSVRYDDASLIEPIDLTAQQQMLIQNED